MLRVPRLGAEINQIEPFTVVRPKFLISIVAATLLWGCQKDQAPGGPRDQLPPATDKGSTLTTTRLFPTKSNPGVVFHACLYASPLGYKNQVVVEDQGQVVGLDPKTGDEKWHVDLPVPGGDLGLVVATPALVGHRLVVGYQTVGKPDSFDPRKEQRVAVVDLDKHALDPDFDVLTLDHTFKTVDGDDVPFLAPNAIGRSQLTHAVGPGGTLGRVYVTFGNIRDIQPWHGFVVEVDLDAWKAGHDAVTGSFVDTPESDCGMPGSGGSRERVCGGGLWAPSGAEVIPKGDDYDLVFAPDNGMLDLSRHDYANTMLRISPGLQFDDGCDPDACANFNPDDPSTACMESCSNLFIPRILPDQKPYAPESGVCDGDTMFVCWAHLDYGSGSTPRYFEYGGFHLLAYPLKDGSVSLVDADHLGTLYDRKQIVKPCGTKDDKCRWDWAGMIVTQPALVSTDPPRLLVPTFEPDKTHPAGVVALDVELVDGKPKFRVAWQAPSFDDPAAIKRFREHPSRIRLQKNGDQTIAWLLDAIRSKPGSLVGIDAKTGDIVVDRGLVGSGMRFTQPLLLDDTIYANTCNQDGTAYIEAYRVDQKKN